MQPDTQVLTGQVLLTHADPFEVPSTEALEVERRGAVAIEGGLIRAAGPADAVRAAYPQAPIVAHGDALIVPGFVDAHAHYPQTGIVASWGSRLIEWLERHTFPAEARLGDPVHAADVAARYLDLLVAHGTTSVASFCTSHEASVDAFFAAAEARGMRVAAGLTAMDRNVPEALRDTAQGAYDRSRALVERWHGRGRASYAIAPRFAPTSTPTQLDALGALWAEHPSCLMQTHLAEQLEEVAWVARLFPDAPDYLGVYERHGLLGERGLYGHAIHLTPRERARLAEVGAAAIHCPTSNTFIGSGLMDVARTRADGIAVGLATDTGGGSSFSMLRTMAAAYEVGQLCGRALHPAQLVWLATQGSARAMHASDRVGRIAPGMEADLAVLDLASTPSIAQAAARAEDAWGALFPTIMMGDDRAVLATYVAGRPAKGNGANPTRPAHAQAPGSA